MENEVTKIKNSEEIWAEDTYLIEHDVYILVVKGPFETGVEIRAQ